MTIGQKYFEKIVLEENNLLFNRFNKILNTMFVEIDNERENTLRLEDEKKKLSINIENYKNQIKKLEERIKKQEFLEKNKEIQKESVKIVSNKAKVSKDNLEIKKIIAELIQEIDACMVLLEEDV